MKGKVTSADGNKAVVTTEKGTVAFIKAAELKVGDTGSFAGKITPNGTEFIFKK